MALNDLFVRAEVLIENYSLTPAVSWLQKDKSLFLLLVLCYINYFINLCTFLC